MGFAWCFSHAWIGFWGGSPWRWSIIFIPSHQGDMLLLWLTTLDVNFNHLDRACLSRFLCYKVTLLSLFPYISFWKEVTKYRPHLRSGKDGPLQGRASVQNICNSSTWEIYLFSPIYFFVQSFSSVWIYE